MRINVCAFNFSDLNAKPGVYYMAMDNLPNTASRLTALEVKLAFAEDALDQLNTIVYRQQQIVDVLTREFAALREQAPAEVEKFRSLHDELPPHY